MSTDAYLPALHRYGSTPYRRVGRSGLHLPLVSLGCWQNFGEDRNPQSLRSLVRRAFDSGINHVDLANNYGPPPGSAEAHVGWILRQDFTAHRDELVISTKAGDAMWPGPYGAHGSRKHLLASLDQSLGRLDLEYVDVFYHQQEDPTTPLEETMGALSHAVTSGKALYVGLSNYSPERTREAARMLREMGTPLLIQQAPYSMFTRHIERGLLDVVAELGIGLAVYSPLQQGLLTNRYLSDVPRESRAGGTSSTLAARQVRDREYQARARALLEIAHRRGQSLAQMALAWALRHPQVTTALVGASGVHQLEQNVAALEQAEFTDGELAGIDTDAVDGTAAR